MARVAKDTVTSDKRWAMWRELWVQAVNIAREECTESAVKALERIENRLEAHETAEAEREKKKAESRKRKRAGVKDGNGLDGLNIH